MIGPYPLGPMCNPCVPNSIHATKPFAQLPLPLGVPQKNLSIFYKAFVHPVLTYASPGWFPFLCNTTTNHLEVLHRAACRVNTGCLFSTPSSLLLLEAQLPPLKLTLEHQTLYSFERALRLLPDFSSLYALAIRNVPGRL